MSIENYGRYQLLKRIATGGMAEIHLARRAGARAGDGLLVVKRILPHLAENAEFVAMFLDEARIAARLNHPNVVQIHDLGAQGGTYFIAMEYIHGEDVRRIWKRAANRGMTIPQPLVCRIIADACAGLDDAHRKTDERGRRLDIVHRDVSPQNLLVTFDGVVKVVDFGIAKAADQATVTRSGVLKGKYSYMSPEQAAGQRVDARSDLFALGIVLHELLTGTRLFKRGNDLQTLHAVTECQVHPPSRDNPNVPPDLDAIVLRALAREPADRHADAGELRRALEGWLGAHGHRTTQADLAAFVRSLFADRLEEERAEAVTPAPEPEDDEEAPAAPPASTEHSASERMTELVARVRAPAELTQPVDAGRWDPAEASLSVPTEAMSLPGAFALSGDLRPVEAAVSRTGRTAAWRVAAAVSLSAATLGVLAWQVGGDRSAGPGRVQVRSDPPGASVSWDGEPRAALTPCVLEGIAPGTYALRLTKPGYLPRQLTVEVANGERVLPSLTLARDPAAAEESHAVDAPVAVWTGAGAAAEESRAVEAPVAVRTGVGAAASGPVLAVAGEAAGRTSGTVATGGLAPASAAQVDVQVGEAPPARAGGAVAPSVARSELGATAPFVAPTAATSGASPAAAGGSDAAARTARRGSTGTVRFIVTPWGEVRCDGRWLGRTPFGEKVLPVGTHACEVAHPRLGTVRRRVEVKANEVEKVLVQFEG